MPLSRKAFAAVALAALLFLPLAAGGAEVQAEEGPGPIQLQPGILQVDDLGTLTVGSLDPNESLGVHIRLRGPSMMSLVGAYEANTTKSASPNTVAEPMALETRKTLHQGIIARQQPAIQAVEAVGGTVVGTFQSSFNGLHVKATRAQLLEILATPGVESVSFVPIFTLDMDDARGHLGGDLVEQELGWTGEGVTIAVSDTGIDYTHASFGGSGDPADFVNIDPTFVADGTFPTEKVVGGWDFVGENYCNTGACDPADLEPDENPIPSHMHGTHVAGIAAGIATANVPPGMAPDATLVALKIFSNGATDVGIQSFEWVINHNLYLDDPDSEMVPGFRPDTKIDVMNNSWGGDWGGGGDVLPEVMRSAIDAGITVVASAGNDAQTPFITGSPAAGSQLALSVASGWPPGEEVPVFYAEWEGDDGSPQTMEEDATTDSGWAPSLEETGAIGAPVAWYGLACNDEDGNAPDPEQDISEKIALIERGACNFTEKVANAESFGAVAALLFTDDRPKGGMGGDCDPCPGIPVLMIDREPGLQLRTLVQDGTLVNGLFDPDRFEDLDWITDTISGFSSRGPARMSAGIKPQITGPGSQILAALMGSGDQGAKIDGTSMSGPAVAGVTALLWNRNRAQGLELGADDIAALAMNYADPRITEGHNQTGPLVGVARQGAGLANAYDSAVGGTLVRSDEGLAEISYGLIHLDTEETMEATRSFTVRNLSDAEKSYEIDYRLQFPDEDTGMGVELDFSEAMITVPAGESAEVDATILVTLADLREWDNFGFNTISSFGTDPPRVADALVQEMEIDGYIHITEVDAEGNEVDEGDMVSVPFYSLPRADGCLVTDLEDDFDLGEPGTEITTRYTNECGAITRMTASHLLGDDPIESETNEDMPAKLDGGAVGVRYGTLTNADGSTSDVIEVAIATADGRRLPVDADIYVYFDGDMDGVPDNVGVVVPAGALNPALPTDVWGSIYTPVVPDTREPNLGAIPAQTIWQVNWDIDETVSAFLFPIEAIGEGLSWDSGDVEFGLSVAVRDGMEDFPMTDDYLGEDVMPDDLDDGGYYHFDQARLDCVSLEAPAQGGGSIPLLDVNAGFPALTGNVFVETTLSSCEDITSPGMVGILSRFIYNSPGMSAWSAKWGVLGEAAPPGGEIFMPFTSNNHEFPTEEPTEPTEEPGEPTEEPGEPTEEPTAEPTAETP